MSHAFRHLAEVYLLRLKESKLSSKLALSKTSSIDEQDEMFETDSAMRSIDSTFQNADTNDNQPPYISDAKQIKIIKSVEGYRDNKIKIENDESN